MSGSPVYVDGKLIGAVSYALGSFSKEPIAGITPIAEMTDSTTFNDVRPPGARVKVEFPLTREGLSAAFRKALAWNRPFAERPNDTELTGITAVAGLGGSQLGTLLRPIATPLVMSGFEPDLADMFGGAFRRSGLSRAAAASPVCAPAAVRPALRARGRATGRRDAGSARPDARRYRDGDAHRRRSGLRLRQIRYQP
jgi:hypothetical protein